MKKQTLLKHLVDSGLCENHKIAASMILAGKALVNNKPGFAGQMLRKDDEVRLKESPLPYAGKGGLKLETALRAFQISLDSLVCLDAGASTGGFTDCLLKHGAQLVYAVDVGYGQLDSRLRQHHQVVNLEKTNLSDPGLQSLSPRPSFATCDLSYLSLREAVPYYQTILHGQGQMIALVKPLFEIEDSEARRSGIIAEDRYAPLLYGLIDHFNACPGTVVQNLCHSPITGNNGTLEFFLHLVFGQKEPGPQLDSKVVYSVDQSLQLQPYRHSVKEYA